mgnify:CR=1 FL=1
MSKKDEAVRQTQDAQYLSMLRSTWEQAEALAPDTAGLLRSQPLPTALIAWRRHIHRHPELSFQEEETSRFIASVLAGVAGVETRLLKPTGVIAELHGTRGPGGSVALRADIDALPLQEETGLPYVSENAGVMHACGHDGHVAAALAAAHLLAATRAEWSGTVRFLFQPAEEKIPGGALAIIAAGGLEGVDAVFGLHLAAELPLGSFLCLPGPEMASADEFDVHITGVGGHGSQPHRAQDAIWAATQTVLALHGVVSRRIAPLRPAVVTVGAFNAGYNFNVIAPEATLRGTVRSFDADVRDRLQTEIERACANVAAACGVTARVDYRRGYPALRNDPVMTQLFADAARDVLRSAGRAGDEAGDDPLMASEDFAYYLEQKPGAFLQLGAAPASGPAQHHTPRFTFDEEALPRAAELLSLAALRTLPRGGDQG